MDFKQVFDQVFTQVLAQAYGQVNNWTNHERVFEEMGVPVTLVNLERERVCQAHRQIVSVLQPTIQIEEICDLVMDQISSEMAK